MEEEENVKEIKMISSGIRLLDGWSISRGCGAVWGIGYASSRGMGIAIEE